MDGEKVYIASQGPLPHTVNDFWRMLWTYKVKVLSLIQRSTLELTVYLLSFNEQMHVIEELDVAKISLMYFKVVVMLCREEENGKVLHFPKFEMYNCIEKILYSMFQILLIIHVFATF